MTTFTRLLVVVLGCLLVAGCPTKMTVKKTTGGTQISSDVNSSEGMHPATPGIRYDTGHKVQVQPGGSITLEFFNAFGASEGCFRFGPGQHNAIRSNGVKVGCDDDDEDDQDREQKDEEEARNNAEKQAAEAARAQGKEGIEGASQKVLDTMKNNPVPSAITGVGLGILIKKHLDDDDNKKQPLSP